MADTGGLENLARQVNRENFSGNIKAAQRKQPAKEPENMVSLTEPEEVSDTYKRPGRAGKEKLLEIPEFPDPDHKCPKCGGTKHVFEEGKGWVRCSCFESAWAMRRFADSDIPPLMKGIRPENFRMYTEKDREFGKLIHEAFLQKQEGHVFIHSKNPSRLFGGTLYCLGRMIFNPDILSFGCGRLEEVTDTYMQGESIENLLTAGILLFSIGDEIIASKAHAKTLYTIMYHRWMQMLPTVILSSVSRTNLGKTYAKNIEDMVSLNYTEYRF